MKTLVDVLESRFGPVAPTITAGLEQVKEKERLVRLTDQAALCTSLQAFENGLHHLLHAPASKRDKKREI